MRKIDPRFIFGAVLILAGILNLLGNFRVLENVSGVFWGILFVAVGAAFLYGFISYPQNWWPLLPALAFFGMAASAFLPNSLDALKGLAFLGSLGIAFWVVYFTGRERWWAIIPGGVLLTLGVVSALDDSASGNSGGVFFMGLGLTFLLTAVLPSTVSRNWAYIPAAILLVFGAILGTPYSSITNYIWPIILVLLGGYLIWNFLRPRTE